MGGQLDRRSTVQIEFMGRAIRISTGGHNIIYVYPQEIFEIVKWAKEHEFQLIEKQCELQLMDEKKQQREAKEQQCPEE
jgi:hypothetical protein